VRVEGSSPLFTTTAPGKIESFFAIFLGDFRVAQSVLVVSVAGLFPRLAKVLVRKVVLVGRELGSAGFFRLLHSTSGWKNMHCVERWSATYKERPSKKYRWMSPQTVHRSFGYQ
jgi:hypothetical protein